MIPELEQFCDHLTYEAERAGWKQNRFDVATSGRSAYLGFKRHDGLSIVVRISDHRSNKFKPRMHPLTRRDRYHAAFSLRVGRTGPLAHLVRWLRSHAPTPPPAGP